MQAVGESNFGSRRLQFIIWVAKPAGPLTTRKRACRLPEMAMVAYQRSGRIQVGLWLRNLTVHG